MNVRTVVSLSACLILALASLALAQGGMGQGQGSGQGNMGRGAGGGRAMSAQAMDHKFLMDAAHGNLAEIRAGEAARNQATSPDIKSFAQMMIADHTRANAELAQIAQKMGMTMPTELDPHHRAVMDGMSKLSGMEFDMAYVKGQLADHAVTVDMLMMYGKEGKNRDLEAYAKRMRPAVERHYEMARQMDMKMHMAMMSMR
jgi:putative membrane protein